MTLSKGEFLLARNFIVTDIRRELSLAHASERWWSRCVLRLLRVPKGGGNFLAALGLLCYTEFCGKLKYGCSTATENFNKFFDDLGTDYAAVRSKGLNVYDLFRCGLAHEYYAKRSCTISMFGRGIPIALGQFQNGRLYFIVEHYFQDFVCAMNKFGMDHYGIQQDL